VIRWLVVVVGAVTGAYFAVLAIRPPSYGRAVKPPGRDYAFAVLVAAVSAAAVQAVEVGDGRSIERAATTFLLLWLAETVVLVAVVAARRSLVGRGTGGSQNADTR
jgi:hypothetical protein